MQRIYMYAPSSLERNTNRTLEEQEAQWQAPIERSKNEGDDAEESRLDFGAGWGFQFLG
jgi:hypothetical protein